MFTPFTLRGLTLRNRVVVSPMDMYSAEDGTPNEFHLVHLGARALGGAGLLITEMTCVSPEARITLGCTGMYAPSTWRRGGASPSSSTAEPREDLPPARALRARKGSTQLMWEGRTSRSTRRLAGDRRRRPSPYAPGMQVPREMTRADMDQRARASSCAPRAWRSMPGSTCSSSTARTATCSRASSRRSRNQRHGRVRRLAREPPALSARGLPRPCARSGRPERPMSVRISATDWVEGGIDGADAVRDRARLPSPPARTSSTSPPGRRRRTPKPVYGRMFQTPFSDRIRNETGMPTIAVGNITEPDQVNSIIAAGRADLCALAPPALADPNWTLHAAARARLCRAGVAGAVSPRQAAAGAHSQRKAKGHRMTERDFERASRDRHRRGARHRARHRGRRWRLGADIAHAAWAGRMAP